MQPRCGHTAEQAWTRWDSSLNTATFVSPRRITAPVPGAIEEGRSLPTSPALSAPQGSPAPAVEWVEDRPERTVLRVTAPQGGYLVLRDTYFPGWSATVNGERAELIRADLLFRAVALSPSAAPQEVALTYRSLPFERGVLLSGVAIAMTIGLAMMRRVPWPR